MKVPRTTGRSQFYLVSSLMLVIVCPRASLAQATTVLVSVRDSTGVPVFPSRFEVMGTGISELGDSLGRVVLRRVPSGPHQLVVRGIGFFQGIVTIEARGDTLRLPPVVLRRNPLLDSLHIVIPQKGS